MADLYEVQRGEAGPLFVGRGNMVLRNGPIAAPDRSVTVTVIEGAAWFEKRKRENPDRDVHLRVVEDCGTVAGWFHLSVVGGVATLVAREVITWT